MSNYTIIKQNWTVRVDGEPVQSFNFSAEIDDNFNALKWDDTGTKRLEETIDGVFTVSQISDFSPYQPIIDTFYDNQTRIGSAIQLHLDLIIVEYLDGLLEEFSVTEAYDNDITYHSMDLEDAQTEKIDLVSTQAIELTNELFNSSNTLSQIKSRTMLSYNWSSLLSKETLTDDDEEDIVLYNEVLAYLDILDLDVIDNTENIDATVNTTDVMEYEIVLTPIPPELQDTSRRALVYLKQSSV